MRSDTLEEAAPPNGGPPDINISPADENRIATLLTILAGSTQIVNDPHRFYREGSNELITGLHKIQDYCYAEIAAILTPPPVETEPTTR